MGLFLTQRALPTLNSSVLFTIAKVVLLLLAINVNECVSTAKFDKMYGCRQSLPDGIMRATAVMIGGKRALVCGYGDVGKGFAVALRGACARVMIAACFMIAEVDSICALQACMEGLQVVALTTVVNNIDNFVSATGNMKIIKVSDMEKIKNSAISGNNGHFDNEIETARLEGYEGVKVKNIKPQVDGFEFPDGHGVIVLCNRKYFFCHVLFFHEPDIGSD